MTHKKIGLVLSGGATHGFAQIGVIKILEEQGIILDLIVGCSVGSLVGVSLSSGKKMEEIEKLMLKESIFTFLTPSMGTQGLIKSEKIVTFLLKNINVTTFEDLKIKLIVNSTNLKNGEEIVFEKGPLLPALSASISIPGIFTPIQHEDKLLIDGGFYEIAPLHLAKDMDVIILIDVSKFDNDITTKSNMLSILKQSVANLQQHVIDLSINNLPKHQELILIRPDISQFRSFEYKKANYLAMIKLGENSAKKILSEERTRKILNL
ncbi:MAG: patatin-like phospholipase family protein [Candidatus Woesearchaeota archaeon]|jgi:NTE family protein